MTDEGFVCTDDEGRFYPEDIRETPEAACKAWRSTKEYEPVYLYKVRPKTPEELAGRLPPVEWILEQWTDCAEGDEIVKEDYNFPKAFEAEFDVAIREAFIALMKKYRVVVDAWHMERIRRIEPSKEEA